MKTKKKSRIKPQKRSRQFPAAEGLEVIHHIPGRVRFRIPALRGSEALRLHVERALSVSQGIRSVSASAGTGTVLVHFEEKLIPAAFTRALSGILAGFERLPARERVLPPEGGTNPVPSDRGGAKSVPAWHTAEAQQVLSHFQSAASTGLSEDEARQRLLALGKNALPAMLPRTFGEILLSQVRTLPVLLIFGAAGISLLTGGLAEGMIAAGVAVLNALVGSATEKKAEKTLEIVREAVALNTIVLRGGKLREIPFAEVVEGDVLDLQIGARVPADARLVKAEHLAVDEAALTGESIPVLKFTRPHRRERIPISQQRNMLFRGTLVVEGKGRALVVATGRRTALGRLQEFLGVVFPPEAVMAKSLKRLALQLLGVAAGASALLSVFSLLRGQGLLQVLSRSLSFIAGAIPSSLSTLAISAFALSHRDMQRQRILVRRLRALGSLASAQVVCFDKTGTLTHNRMTTAEVHAGERRILIPEEPWKPTFRRGLAEDPDLSWLMRLTALCNEAEIQGRGGLDSPQGSSTEQALLVLAERAGVDTTALRQGHPTLHVRHRSESHPFMVTVHPLEGAGKLVAVKGSPMDVLERCASWRRKGEIVPLLGEDRSRVETENFRMSGEGLRVLGVAYHLGTTDPDERILDQDGPLVWAGLIGFSDPLRTGTRELIATLHRAGIRTAVITGDQSLTAAHIGEQLNLAGGEQLRVLDALNLKGLDAEAMRNLVAKTHVFARLNPTQKLQVIQAYQSAGTGVVMVGDGMNDVLALKVADVGIAMGRDGTDLARKAADLVLEDDDLRKVAVAIGGGRAFQENIKRSLRFLLTANHVDWMSDLAAAAGDLGRGISPWQSLWTNLVCLSLASERPRFATGAMQMPEESGAIPGPQEIRDTAADAAGLIAAAGPPALYALARYGLSSSASSLFFRSVSIHQLLYALECTAGPGPLLRLILWGTVGGHLALVLGRGFGGLLDVAALGAGALLTSRLRDGKRRPRTNL